MRTRAGIACAVVLLLAALRAAQPDRGEIAGTVVDAAGAAVPGVTVTMTGPERRTAITGRRGEFRFSNLIPGSYEARFELAGFTTAVRKTSVGAGQAVRMSIRLQVALRRDGPVAEAQRGVVGGAVGNVPGRRLPVLPPRVLNTRT